MRPSIEAVYQSYLSLLKTAEECQLMHLAAELPVPEKLARFISRDGVPARINVPQAPATDPVAASPRAVIANRRPYKVRTQTDLKIPPRPNYGEPPIGVRPGWIAVKTVDASPLNLTLAVLKAASGPVTRAQVSNAVSELRGLKGSNAGYNAMTNLTKTHQLSEVGDRFVLKDETLGGFLGDGYLWLPEDKLSDADRAAHRREAILLLLQLNGPLLTAEISRGLTQTNWVKAGRNDNFVKGDMNQMEREKIVLRLEDKRWERIR